LLVLGFELGSEPVRHYTAVPTSPSNVPPISPADTQTEQLQPSANFGEDSVASEVPQHTDVPGNTYYRGKTLIQT
jgi:hypothetical protein